MPHRPTSTPAEAVALLEATLEATHDGIVVVDINRRVVLWNSNYLRMFDLTSDVVEGGVDAINAALRDKVEDADTLRAISQKIWSEPGRERFDTVRFKDGRVFERYVAPHFENGQVVWLVASLREVTHAVKLQQELEQHRAFLERAQEVAHIGSWVADLDGADRLVWSGETYRIFGVERGQFNGTSAAFFAFVHEGDRAAVRAASEMAQRELGRYEIDHRIVRADGTVRWVHEEADIIRDSTGRPLRMIGTVQDITERRLLEDQLRQAQKMEAIGRLAGGIAHDLNNALTAIAGYSELAMAGVAADHPARADVAEIRRAAERAASVTRQLLAFSRKQLLEPRLFDLNDVVGAIARLLARLVGPDIRVQTRLSDQVRPILGDPGQVEQAIVNLAVNARDAMPSGGDLTLATSYERLDETFTRTHVPMAPGEYVLLRVSDTGQGMSPETRARIFEPFFTTKPAGKGTGLGLSMVYGTLKQIGGFIFVDSDVGRGTTFRLYFPPAPDALALVESVAEPARATQKKTLLIAEDESAVRNLVASALRDDAYSLLLASSAEEALELAAAHAGTIDLLLTDAIMPGKSGVELATELVRGMPALRVIFMSGYTEEDLNLTGLAQPPVILQKPFTPRELRRRIRDALER